MHRMMELKEVLCDELNEYTDKRKLTYEDLDIIDKLTHSIKSLETILAMEGYGDGYSNDYRTAYTNNSYGNSYARNRDSMGRYSREAGYSNEANGKEGMAMELREAMDKATSEKEREAIQSCMKELGL